MISENTPIPGFYTCRLVKNGPLMPVKIHWQTSPRVMCDECNGTGYLDFQNCEAIQCDACHGKGLVPTDDDLLLARVGLEDYSAHEIWLRCAKHPISLFAYNQRMAVIMHAIEHDPRRPEARPREAVNLATLPPITPSGETK